MKGIDKEFSGWLDKKRRNIIEQKIKTVEGIDIEFSEWLEKNGGYNYYETFLSKQMSAFYTQYYGNVAYVHFEGYLIMVFELQNGSIYLVDSKEYGKEKSRAVQQKLLHEYRETFNIYEDKYKLTQLNMLSLQKYIEKACKKISSGFEKYEKILERNNLSEYNSSYMKVHISNAFSVAEFNRLISAYNELYSLLYCISEYGYDEVALMDMDEVKTSHSMVLESISVGSDGFFIGVLSQVVATAIIALGKALLQNDKIGYEEKKRELIEMAKNESVDKGERILILTTRWDNYLRLKESGRVPSHVIDTEINKITDEIKVLQGNVGIDIYI